MESLLSVKNLTIEFGQDKNLITAVNQISFDIPPAKTLGLVGESGSGKSVTSLSIMGLLPNGKTPVKSGQIFFEGKDLLQLPEKEMRKIRGNRISMIFQEPMTSLNPVFTVGYQIVEALRLHRHLGKSEAWEKATELLHQVGILDPHKRVKSYPHEMSGGQRQRVMIAMAIACEPDLLIADEPTTALDVTIQKQILELLLGLQEQYKMSLLFITHDLGVIANMAHQVAVMYRGQIVEKAETHEIFKNPQHPYTKGLLACRPNLKKNYARLATLRDFMDESGRAKTFDASSMGEKKEKLVPENQTALLEVKNLVKHYPLKTNLFGQVTEWVHAVDDVSFNVYKGQTLGLVGESGCGKTTLGRTLLRLVEPTAGKIFYNNVDLTSLNSSEMRKMRRKIQIIFQDPYASLNPRMTVGAALIEPMTIHGLGGNKKERVERACFLLDKVGLESSHLSRYPHEFSGGQRQRICIARALAVEPEFMVCDESVSALDVSIQAQILNLIKDLQKEFDLTTIFISHDLAVIKFISDVVAVMNSGKIVEYSPAHKIYSSPQNPYTQKLLDSVPQISWL